jgi:hypothetical protein
MDHNGTAHQTNQMAALATRTNKIEAITQTDLLQLGENQSQLAHAYKSIQTNHVPSEVTTEPSTLRSSVTSPASAYFTTNDINTNLATEVAELRKQLENLTRQAARECYKFPNESIATPLMSVRKLEKANMRTTNQLLPRHYRFTTHSKLD